MLRRGCVLSPIASADFVEIDCADAGRFVRVQPADLYDDAESIVEATRVRAANPAAMSQAALKRMLAKTAVTETPLCFCVVIFVCVCVCFVFVSNL